MNDFDELDELERELGPSLRAALRRVAGQITDGPESRSTEGEMLMNYLKAPTEDRTTPDADGGSRRRTRFVVAALLAAAAVVAAAALVISRGDDGAPTDQPVGAPVPTGEGFPVISGPTPYFLDLRTGEATPLADNIVIEDASYVASPDGSKFAFNTCCTSEDVATISNVDGSDAREVEPAAGFNVYGVRWSPDGTKIVYQERDGAGSKLGNLVVQDVATGSRTQVTDIGASGNGSWFLSPRFSADGQSVLYHLPRNAVSPTAWDAWSVPVTGGEPTLLLEDAFFPISFPDGEEIAFVTPTENFEGDTISIANADGSGSPRVLLEPKQSIFFSPSMSPDGTRIAYVDGGAIYVVDVDTGQSFEVANRGGTVEWLDDDTLVVNP